MKTDRILEIMIYLMNHEQASARVLAERFGVSVRTIQRDMVSLSAIGIPVYATGGKSGGYAILPTYRVKNASIRADEQQLIIHALESLATSYRSDTLDALIEKYNAIIDKEGGQKVFWDFGVTRENQQVQQLNTLLEQAIAGRQFVAFHYRNAAGACSEQEVEPLAIHYKWYAWYLFAYSEKRGQYRTYKVARMEALRLLNRRSTRDHGDIAQRMQESEQAYYQTCISIEIQFDAQHSSLIREYFPDCPIEHLSDGRCSGTICVPAGERLWKALLLSFGRAVTVVSPPAYRQELIDTAENFLSNYDTQLSR